MNDQYDEWEKDSPRWQAALDRGLAEHSGTDVLISYRDVALAFPSRTSLASTFDYPRIDESALRAWASTRGLHVQMAPELNSGNSHGAPPIRFTMVKNNHAI